MSFSKRLDYIHVQKGGGCKRNPRELEGKRNLPGEVKLQRQATNVHIQLLITWTPPAGTCTAGVAQRRNEMRRVYNKQLRTVLQNMVSIRTGALFAKTTFSFIG